MFGGIVHNFAGNVSEVSFGWGGSVHEESFTEDEVTVVWSEWVSNHEDWFEPDFGVLSVGHMAGGTVEGPPWELFDFV